MNILMTLLAITTLTFFGVIAIVYSQKMRKYLIKRYAEDELAKYNPVYWWVISPLYIPFTQFFGAMAIAVAILLLFMLVKHL